MVCNVNYNLWPNHTFHLGGEAKSFCCLVQIKPGMLLTSSSLYTHPSIFFTVFYIFLLSQFPFSLFLNFNVLFMFFCSSFSLRTSFCCLWNFSSFSYWFSHSLHLLLSLLYQCSYPLILPLTSSFLLIFSLSIFAYLCPGSRRKCIKKK